MKNSFIAAILLCVCMYSIADDVPPTNLWNSSPIMVQRIQIGSGTPTNNVTPGSERAIPIANDLYNVPNYLPGYPTAASIWPRVISVNCDRQLNGSVVCGGYDVNQSMIGRGEYIYIKPIIHELPSVSIPPLQFKIEDIQLRLPPVFLDVPKKKRVHKVKPTNVCAK